MSKEEFYQIKAIKNKRSFKQLRMGKSSIEARREAYKQNKTKFILSKKEKELLSNPALYMMKEREINQRLAF